MTPAAVVAVILLIGGLTLIGFKFGHQPGAGQAAISAGDDGASAAGRAATGPFRAGEGFLGRLAGMWGASAEVERLKAENRELMAWKSLAERLAERNARYEALLRMPADSFGEGADIENAIAAQLVLDSGGPFTRTLVANAGADHGVHVGYIAVNENGLVGRVVSVGRRSARVLMMDDYNSRIPVMGQSSRVRAVMAGQATRAPNLITAPFQVESPRLDYIVGAQALREGERIITSGDGGVFPRGIPVGLAQRGADGAWRVSLSASQQPIDFVRLIPFVGAETPEDAPVEDAGPPAAARSSVAAITRTQTAPPPAPLAAPQAAPRPAAPAPGAAAAQPRPAAPAQPAAQPRPQPASATPAPATPPAETPPQ